MIRTQHLLCFLQRSTRVASTMSPLLLRNVATFSYLRRKSTLCHHDEATLCPPRLHGLGFRLHAALQHGWYVVNKLFLAKLCRSGRMAPLGSRERLRTIFHSCLSSTSLPSSFPLFIPSLDCVSCHLGDESSFPFVDCYSPSSSCPSLHGYAKP